MGYFDVGIMRRIRISDRRKWREDYKLYYNIEIRGRE